MRSKPTHLGTKVYLPRWLDLGNMALLGLAAAAIAGTLWEAVAG